MGATMELNISDEKYAELMDALSWRRSATLESLCGRALNEYLIEYYKETIPYLGFDSETQARLEKESKHKLNVMCFEGLIESIRAKETKKEGNVIRLAKRDIRPTLKDFLSNTP